MTESMKMELRELWEKGYKSGYRDGCEVKRLEKVTAAAKKFIKEEEVGHDRQDKDIVTKA